MMNQKLTIRMLQDVLRRLQLGPDPAASIQAGSQERCVQLAASFGLISVESAEKLCSGGLDGAFRGIMDREVRQWCRSKLNLGEFGLLPHLAPASCRV